MKYFSCCLLLMTLSVDAATTVSGKLLTATGCSPKAMVWLSLDKENYQERLLLLHTEVPQNGTFAFYVRPGSYQVRATDQAGCEFLKKITITKDSAHFDVRLVKK